MGKGKQTTIREWEQVLLLLLIGSACPKYMYVLNSLTVSFTLPCAAMPGDGYTFSDPKITKQTFRTLKLGAIIQEAKVYIFQNCSLCNSNLGIKTNFLNGS